MYDFKDIQQQALGQWEEILGAYGINCRPKQRNVPCILCGGTDRSFWKYPEGKVMLHCRHCGTHFADKLLLELAFANDFGRMCQELGDYLHCQPAERKEQVRTQAKIAQSTGDLALAKHKIEQAKSLQVERSDGHHVLLRYGIHAPCFTMPEFDGALFPLKIAGQLVDWIAYTDDGQGIVSGRAARGSKLVIKPKQTNQNMIFITPDVIDAYHLFNRCKRMNIVICCGELWNLHPVADSLPDRYRVVAAIPSTLDALEALQTTSLDFIMPNDPGRKFCEIDYKFKPGKIHSSREAGEIYLSRIDAESE